MFTAGPPGIRRADPRGDQAVRRNRVGMLFGAIALATAGVISAAGPAAAATSCTISEFPAIAAGQSGLKVACLVT
jgi:hypothetical protein